jgi:hypothetical protein
VGTTNGGQINAGVTPAPPVSTRASGPSAAVATPEDTKVSLPAEELRLAIGKALQNGDLDGPIEQLSRLSDGPLKMEECQHLYDYVKKNLYDYAQKKLKLEEATRIVEMCWEGELKNQKLLELEHERLKY